MNYQKLDATLAIALEDRPSPERSTLAVPLLTVFIHLAADLDAEAIATLEQLGVSPAQPGQICTATLALPAIDHLSEQSWVRRLQLSQTLRPSG
jgi:hypothetical protein